MLERERERERSKRASFALSPQESTERMRCGSV
jgi:hypothetical protein